MKPNNLQELEMTITDQYNEVVIFARACRDAEKRNALWIRRKYTWKIKRIIDDLIMLDKASDRSLIES